jgi:glycosyltransferase involved in cell wall biosynthesis
MAKKNILFVAYQFPPLAVGGSYRPYKFVKQLKESFKEINPLVLSLDPSSYREVYDTYNLDLEAEKEVEELRVKVYRASSPPKEERGKLGQFFEIYFNIHRGQEGKWWRQSFKETFTTIIKKEKIDLVYVTCPPFSIGTLVRKEMKAYPSIPLLVDMRDNWSLWVSQPFGTRIHYWLNRLFERKLYRSASAVIGVTPNQLEDIKKVYRGNDSGKFFFIPNSFEPVSLEKKTYRKKANTLTISYTGAFYYDPNNEALLHRKWYKRKGHKKLYYWPRKEHWIYRSPYFLFKMVKRIKELHPNIELRIKIAGYDTPWLEEMIKEFGLEEEVQFKGFLKGEALQQFYEESDLLLLTSVKVEGGNDYCIASKSYDYIKAGKRIIALVAEGAQKHFLEKATNALVIDPDNWEAIPKELINLARGETVTAEYDGDYLAGYRLPETTRKLAAVIMKLVD